MKLIYFLISFIFFTATSFCQNKTLIISNNGIDSFKIGMGKRAIEKLLDAKLRPYILPDSISNSSHGIWPNNKYHSYYECNYNGADLIFVFFEHILRLDLIVQLSGSQIVETSTGIKIGISESEFINICMRNKCSYGFLLNKKACFFSDRNDSDARKIFVIFSNAVVSSIGVVLGAHD